MAPSWVEVGAIAGIVAVVLNALGLLLGQDWWGRAARFLRRARPWLRIYILKETDGDWTVRAVVSIRPDKPPLRLYNIQGEVVPTDDAFALRYVPVLFKDDPEPETIRTKEYSYRIRQFPLPPRGKPHLLTVYLAAEGITLRRQYCVIHNGGLRPRNPLRHWIESRPARKVLKKGRRV